MSTLVRSITPDEQQTYLQNGVVLLKGILDLTTINALRRAINLTLTTAHESPAAYDFSALAKAVDEEDWAALEAASDGQHNVADLGRYLKATGCPMLRDGAASGGQFLVDTGSAARLKDFRRLITRGVLPEIAGALLASDEVRLVDDQVFVKAPNTPERTAFHQDATYMHMSGEQCCVLWIAVDETNLTSGTMQYVRGSHLDGKQYQPNMFVSQATLPGAQGDILPDIEADPDQFDLIHFETEPGDVLVHHYKTIHGTGGNLNPFIPRRAASIRYGGDDLRYTQRPGAPARLHHQNQQIEGEPLQGSDFPIVWRRGPQEQAA